LVYHISVSGREFYEMTKRLKERNVLTIYHHDIYIPPFIQQRDLSAVLEAFNQQVRRWSKIIPFTVLYQIEALVKNGFLLPWTVCDLLERMGKIAKQEESTSSKVGTPLISNTTLLMYLGFSDISHGCKEVVFSNTIFEPRGEGVNISP
jgi:hypothetical protein